MGWEKGTKSDMGIVSSTFMCIDLSIVAECREHRVLSFKVCRFSHIQNVSIHNDGQGNIERQGLKDECGR